MNDTSPEIEQMQFEMMIKLGSRRRIELACEMFMAARELIFASMPKGLTKTEQKRMYFQKMYGKPLPEDFFPNEENQGQK